MSNDQRTLNVPLSESGISAIINALRIAAGVYNDDAVKLNELARKGHPNYARLADQFIGQMNEATSIATALQDFLDEEQAK